MADAARTRIQFRQFRCPAGHEFRAACRSVRKASSEEYEEFYRTNRQYDYVHGKEVRPDGPPDHKWLPVPKCPQEGCPLIGDPLTDPTTSTFREFAQIPEAERFYAWLSPDGTRVAPPGYRGAPMPERYKRAGYMVVEASNLAQLDRLEAVRSAQTGNMAYNEMGHFDEPTRQARERAEYSDDMTKDT